MIGVDEARRIWQAQTKVVGSRRRLSYVDISGIEHATREARQYLGEHRKEELPVAMALLVGSSVSRVIGNFFLGLNKPSFPTRLFTVESEAIAWLRSFLN